MERGTRDVGIGVLARLAHAFGVGVRVLLPDTGPPEDPQIEELLALAGRASPCTRALLVQVASAVTAWEEDVPALVAERRRP